MLIARSGSLSVQVEIASNPLGRGGEGSVYEVVKSSSTSLFNSPKDVVAKIYHEPEEGQREAKIRAMVNASPDSVFLAWPIASLYEGSKFVGYIMPKLDHTEYRNWSALAHAGERRKTAKEFGLAYAYIACYNLGLGIYSVNSAGHCLGDINESNISVKTTAEIMIVDTDSAQIRDPNGTIYPCYVGKPEYTAPELTHGKLKDNPRTPASEVFAYAVTVFQMLTGGAHPTDGRYTGSGDSPAVVDKIRQGVYPALKPAKNFDKLDRTPSSALPKDLQRAILRALSVDPNNRGTVSDFLKVLKTVIQRLKTCPKNELHRYDPHDGEKCPWCAETFDPWVNEPKHKATGLTQAALPGVDFGKDEGPTIRRAPIQTPTRRSAPLLSGGGTQTQQTASRSSTARTAPSRGSSQGASNVSMPTRPTMASTMAVKGKNAHKKTRVDYPDGSTGPRPPLSVLFRQQPWFAIRSFIREMPDVFSFYWEPNRTSPRPLLLALLVPLFGVGYMALFVHVLLPWVLKDGGNALGTLVTTGSLVLSWLSLLILGVSGLWRYIRDRNHYPEREKPEKTILNVVLVTVFHGYIWLFVIVLSVVGAIFSSVFGRDSQPRAR